MNHTVSGVRPRLIPCLLVRGGAVYTTRRFQSPAYIGDLLNTVRIFNELEVDELMLLDIDATRNRTAPNFRVLTDVARECFMPLSYGGGVTTIDQMAELYALGIEKVVLNPVLHQRPELLTEAVSAGKPSSHRSMSAGAHPAPPEAMSVPELTRSRNPTSCRSETAPRDTIRRQYSLHKNTQSWERANF
jgi:Histidine biosynthesis protein